MTDIVKLDVGGTVFKTTKSTLTKFDGFFRTMFETPVPVPQDESGAIFVDRSPKHFDLILNFMRDGHVNLQKYSEDVKEIQKEAEYYLLGGLVELCVPKPEVQKMPYFAETYEDMARAVASSTKKIVCTVFFGTNSRNHAIECSMKAIMLYGDRVDFCFREREDDSTKQSCTDSPFGHFRTTGNVPSWANGQLSERFRVVYPCNSDTKIIIHNKMTNQVFEKYSDSIHDVIQRHIHFFGPC
ncbi:unnamed protein product [Caenorhabditis nigoni]|uniref:BTB domain-containing protein n=1 Tax=Caenorhabditis nigoni TaxID=1611254 RepID=A0A2G5VBS8_9PELO|nr:hypothetical protein B9Z55_007892 [Caenorhabditis nigoni]